MDLDLNLDHQLICTVQPKGKNSRKEPQNSDVADGYENENIPEFQWWKFLILFWGMIAFFTSLYSDYKLIAYYIRHKDWNFLTYTLIFMSFPLIATTVVCFYFDVHRPGFQNDWPDNCFTRTFRQIIVIIQLGPVLRKIDVLIYAIRFKLLNDDIRKKRRISSQIYSAKFEIQSMSIIKCYLRSCPLMVLTGFIMVYDYNFDNDEPDSSQWFSLAFHTIRLSYTLVNYMDDPSVPEQLGREIEISFWERAFVGCLALLSQAALILDRIVTLALLAGISPYLALGIGIGHWLVMYVYLSYRNYVNPQVDKYDYDHRVGFAICFNGLLASMLTFTYNKLNWTPKLHRRFNFIVYGLFFIQNTFFVLSWRFSKQRNFDFLTYDNFTIVHFTLIGFCIFFKILYVLCKRSQMRRRFEPLPEFGVSLENL